MTQLLVINPNTTAKVSQNVDALVRDEAGPTIEVRTVTANFGFRYISSRAAVAIAAHAVLDTAAQAVAEGAKPDAIIIACFGDPGLAALREMTGLPVVGFAEAGILAAAADEGSFLIATRGIVWCEMLSELVRRLNLQSRASAVHSIGDLGGDPQIIADFLSEQVHASGASRVVLGGAGLIPALPSIIAACTVPVLDPHRAAVRKAIELAGRASLPPPNETEGEAPGETIGLSVRLTEALSRPTHFVSPRPGSR